MGWPSPPVYDSGIELSRTPSVIDCDALIFASVDSSAAAIWVVTQQAIATSIHVFIVILRFLRVRELQFVDTCSDAQKATSIPISGRVRYVEPIETAIKKRRCQSTSPPGVTGGKFRKIDADVLFAQPMRCQHLMKPCLIASARCDLILDARLVRSNLRDRIEDSSCVARRKGHDAVFVSDNQIARRNDLSADRHGHIDRARSDFIRPP